MPSLAALVGSIMIAAIAVVATLVTTQNTVGQTAPHWEAVSAQVVTGRNVRLTARLVGANGQPVTSAIMVTASRLDMGPEGMQTMTSALRQVASTEPGTVAFETDIAMAGRWALRLTATVTGQAQPVTGVVIFTAAQQRSDATPAAPAAGDRRVLYYRNPMGLADVSPTPKKDSMGMDYIPVYADDLGGPVGTIRISPEKIQRAGVRTQPVERRSLAQDVRAVGTVVPDESRLAATTIKFGGFVEDLFVRTTGAPVTAGQPLLRVWIESKELLDKEVDYLFALKRGEDTTQTENNLRIFGVPEQVIDDLRRTKLPARSVVLTAPLDGIVLEKPAIVGLRFNPGDMLFKTADLSTVWILAQVAERDLSQVRLGQRARISFAAFAGESFAGRVAFVYPELDTATRTATVRIEVPNEAMRIKVGQYADVVIESPASKSAVLAIPRTVIIDSGSRQIAFVAKGNGTFEPRELTLGARGEDFVAVRSGLKEGEEVVVAGNFLIDAESNLQTALRSFEAPQVPQ
jgi:Cu(I)/Ag(I) efflux system membrane fusion protein